MSAKWWEMFIKVVLLVMIKSTCVHVGATNSIYCHYIGHWPACSLNIDIVNLKKKKKKKHIGRPLISRPTFDIFCSRQVLREN